MTTTKTTAPRKTDAEKAETYRRRKTRERLKRAGESLSEWAAYLEQIHADGTGYYRSLLRPPLMQSAFTPTERALANITTAAAGGCELCAAWLEETAAMRERVAHLRNTRPPEKAPDYAGPWMPSLGFHLPRKPRKVPAGRPPMKDHAIAAAGHMAACNARKEARQAERAEQEDARKARIRAMRDEFLAEHPGFLPDA